MENAAAQSLRDPMTPDPEACPGFLFRILRGKRREVVFWSLNFLFWAIIGVIGLLMTRAFKTSMHDAGWAVLVRVSTGFLLTAGLRGVYVQPSFRHRRGCWKLPLLACGWLLLAVLEVFALQALTRCGVSIPGGAESMGIKLMVVRVFLLGIWSTLYFIVHLLEEEHALELRATRAELAAREYELRHLQAQMNPHFVFNALDAVLGCKEDPEAVEEVTRGLADYLAFLLQDTQPLVPLGRELEALEKFLTVQTSRYKRNLVCRINWDRSARSVMVPPMTVQPLLENAFLHRPANHDLPLQIWLTATVEKGVLRVTLSNTGEPVPCDERAIASGGIDALQKRLHLLMGPAARVERQSDHGWIRVSVVIPVPEQPANPDTRA